MDWHPLTPLRRTKRLAHGVHAVLLLVLLAQMVFVPQGQAAPVPIVRPLYVPAQGGCPLHNEGQLVIRA